MTKISDESKGRVKIGRVVKKPITKSDRDCLHKGEEISRKILSKASAKDIITSKWPRGARPGGTAAIGQVVDRNLQVKGCKDLYVVDASVLPKAPGFPPILTIVSLAKRLSHHIATLG